MVDLDEDAAEVITDPVETEDSSWFWDIWDEE